MTLNNKQSKDPFFEPLRAADVSPGILLFYFLVIPVLVTLWSGVATLNTPLVKGAALLIVGGVAFGIVRHLLRSLRGSNQ